MKNYFIKLITHPVAHYLTLTGGLLIMIGTLHNDAHLRMTDDANSYVKQWCRSSEENKKICVLYGSEMD